MCIHWMPTSSSRPAVRPRRLSARRSCSLITACSPCHDMKRTTRSWCGTRLSTGRGRLAPSAPNLAPQQQLQWLRDLPGLAAVHTNCMCSLFACLTWDGWLVGWLTQRRHVDAESLQSVRPLCLHFARWQAHRSWHQCRHGTNCMLSLADSAHFFSRSSLCSRRRKWRRRLLWLISIPSAKAGSSKPRPGCRR